MEKLQEDLAADINVYRWTNQRYPIVPTSSSFQKKKEEENFQKAKVSNRNENEMLKNKTQKETVKGRYYGT